MPFSKSDLINKIAAEHDISKVKATEILKTVTDTIVAETSTNNPVTIAGFGTFTVKKRKAREGKAMGVAFSVPERNALTFKAGSAVSREIND